MLLSPAATGSALGGKLKVFTAWGTRYSQLHAYMSTLRTLAENRVTSARMKDADAGSNANVDTGHNLLKNLLGTLDDAMTLNPLRSAGRPPHGAGSPQHAGLRRPDAGGS